MLISSKFYEKTGRNKTDTPFILLKINSIFFYPMHCHEEFEIIYSKGRGTVEINGEEIKFEKDDIIFINKEYLHSIKATPKGELFIFIFFYEHLDFKNKDYCQIEIIEKLKNNNLLFPAILNKENVIYNEVKGLLSDIIDLNFGNSLVRELRIKCKLYEIICLLYEKEIFITPRDNEKNPHIHIMNYIKSTIVYMEKNFRSVITVDDLAKNVDLNKYYLIKIFKLVTGVTPIVYLRNLRIENSIELLKNGSSVTHAGLMSGFNSVNYYVEAFKKAYKITPKEFKKSVDCKN